MYNVFLKSYLCFLCFWRNDKGDKEERNTKGHQNTFQVTTGNGRMEKGYHSLCYDTEYAKEFLLETDYPLLFALELYNIR